MIGPSLRGAKAMRTVKILGIVVGGVIALTVVTLLAVWLLVNPNDYKGRIAAAVKQSTGRDLLLPGDIKLSIFPWVALELGPASLGNPAGFGNEPFLSFTHAQVRIKLLALLHKRLAIARVEIDGLDLRLRKNAQGRGNWQDAESSTAAAPDHSQTAPSLESLANIRVQGARVSFENLTLENIDLETGSLAGDMLPISVQFDAHRVSSDLSLTAKFVLSETAPRQLRFS